VHDPSRLGWSGDLAFALKNECDGGRFTRGMIHLGSLVFVFLGIVAMNIAQKRVEDVYDKGEQTAVNYTLLINNPPHELSRRMEELFLGLVSGGARDLLHRGDGQRSTDALLDQEEGSHDEDTRAPAARHPSDLQ